MTTQEFSLQFNVLYGGLNSNAGRGLNEYEKSVLLTRAQLEIVKNYYNPQGNKYGTGFEGTEKRRKDLASLVRTGSSSAPIVASDRAFFNQSRLFKINEDVLAIVAEQVTVKSAVACLNGTNIKVRPVPHDEVFRNINNPFRAPNREFCWRLDLENYQEEKVVEIVGSAEYTPVSYKYRYLRVPNPIILIDLATIDPVLSINGISIQTECELPEHLHEEILNRAVEIALEGTANPRLQSNAFINTRSE